MTEETLATEAADSTGVAAESLAEVPVATLPESYTTVNQPGFHHAVLSNGVELGPYASEWGLAHATVRAGIAGHYYATDTQENAEEGSKRSRMTWWKRRDLVKPGERNRQRRHDEKRSKAAHAYRHKKRKAGRPDPTPGGKNL